MIGYLWAGVTHAFAPRTTTRRAAMHSLAAASGLAGALRMDPAHALAAGLLWYTGFFVAAHVIVVPFIASFLAMRDRMARFIRGIVEEELIRFDLRTYQRQFARVFPKMTPPDDDEKNP